MINQEPDGRFRSVFFGTLGADQRFKGLAQALSDLYPKRSEEKRWADCVLRGKTDWDFGITKGNYENEDEHRKSLRGISRAT